MSELAEFDSFNLEDEGTSSEELDVELQELDFNCDIVATSLDRAVYPSLLIDGISTEEEFLFFKDVVKIGEGTTVPLYCTIEGVLVRVGEIELSLRVLLNLKFIGGYTVYLLKSVDSRALIDLSSPAALEKFIYLGR